MIVSLLFIFSIIYYVVIELLQFGQWWNDSIFAFNVGTLVALYEKKIQECMSRYFIAFWVGVCTLFGLVHIAIPHFYGVFTEGSIFSGGYYGGLINAIFPFFVFICILATGFIKSRFLNYAGKISLYVYLVQGAVIKILAAGIEEWYILMIVTISVSILLAAILHQTMKKLIPVK